MSHYDPTIVVGSGTRGGGGPRPVAVKTKAQINAAARMGNLTTAKNQFRAANSVRAVPFPAASLFGLPTHDQSVSDTEL